MDTVEQIYVLSYFKYEEGSWKYIEEEVTESNRGAYLNLTLPKNVSLDTVAIRKGRIENPDFEEVESWD